MTALIASVTLALAPHPAGCQQTYTVAMAQRAAAAVYAGTRHVTRAERRMLGRIERCQRNPRAHGYIKHVYRRLRQAWIERRNPPFNVSEVSWYNDAGTHCCGVYAYYGVASCGSSGLCYAQGTHVEFCDRRCIVATVDDHGPYVGNRAWDLNAATAQAIGFSGLGYVRWRLRN